MLRESSILITLFMSLAFSLLVTTPARASTLCVAGYCDEAPIPPATGIGPGGTHPVSVQPSLLELVPFQDVSGWHYFFSASGVELLSFAIPYFDGWGVSYVLTPDGWTYTLVPVQGSHAQTAIWSQAENSVPGYSHAGAGFVSPFAPTFAEIEMRNANGDIFIRPIYIPLTDSAALAGYVSASLPIPEPSRAMLMALGVVMLVGFQRVARAH